MPLGEVRVLRRLEVRVVAVRVGARELARELTGRALVGAERGQADEQRVRRVRELEEREA